MTNSINIQNSVVTNTKNNGRAIIKPNGNILLKDIYFNLDVNQDIKSVNFKIIVLNNDGDISYEDDVKNATVSDNVKDYLSKQIKVNDKLTTPLKNLLETKYNSKLLKDVTFMCDNFSNDYKENPFRIFKKLNDTYVMDIVYCPAPKIEYKVNANTQETVAVQSKKIKYIKKEYYNRFAISTHAPKAKA